VAEKSEIQNPKSEIRNQNARVAEKSEIRNLNPAAAAVADQASSEGIGHEPPAGDGATRRPEADSKSEIKNARVAGKSEIRNPKSEIKWVGERHS